LDTESEKLANIFVSEISDSNTFVKVRARDRARFRGKVRASLWAKIRNLGGVYLITSLQPLSNIFVSEMSDWNSFVKVRVRLRLG
jgi:hypothetical protein